MPAMRRNQIEMLLDYDLWATERILNAAATLPADWFASSGADKAGLGPTMMHIFRAREGFRGVIMRKPRPFADLFAEYDQMDLSSVELCRAWLERERTATAAMLQDLPEESLEGDVTVGRGDVK